MQFYRTDKLHSISDNLSNVLGTVGVAGAGIGTSLNAVANDDAIAYSSLAITGAAGIASGVAVIINEYDPTRQYNGSQTVFNGKPFEFNNRVRQAIGVATLAGSATGTILTGVSNAKINPTAKKALKATGLLLSVISGLTSGAMLTSPPGPSGVELSTVYNQ